MWVSWGHCHFHRGSIEDSVPFSSLLVSFYSLSVKILKYRLQQIGFKSSVLGIGCLKGFGRSVLRSILERKESCHQLIHLTQVYKEIRGHVLP